MNTNLLENLLKQEDQEFQIVREYLRDNPTVGLNVQLLSKKTEVSEKLIIRWIEQGRLSVKSTTYNENKKEENILSGLKKIKADLEQDLKKNQTSKMYIVGKKKL